MKPKYSRNLFAALSVLMSLFALTWSMQGVVLCVSTSHVAVEPELSGKCAPSNGNDGSQPVLLTGIDAHNHEVPGCGSCTDVPLGKTTIVAPSNDVKGRGQYPPISGGILLSAMPALFLSETQGAFTLSSPLLGTSPQLRPAELRI